MTAGPALRLRRDAVHAHWWNLVTPGGQVWVTWNYRPDADEVRRWAAAWRQVTGGTDGSSQ